MTPGAPEGAYQSCNKLKGMANTGPARPEALSVLRQGLGTGFEQTLNDTFGGDLDIYLAVLDECQRSCDEARQRLESAADAGDLTGVANAAHYIKGSALTLGATELAQVATRLDHSPQHAGAERVQLAQALLQLRATLDRVAALPPSA